MAPLPLLCLCAFALAAVPGFAASEEPPAPRWGVDGQLALEDTEGQGEWTAWFNVDHPGGDGDFESLAAIRFYYGPQRVCPRPRALEARTTRWASPAAAGERVHLSAERGFWCLNREQLHGRGCSNYLVRFRCPPEAAWGPWGPCSTSCGRGRRLRRRQCPGPQGPECPGSPQEAQECEQPACPDCSHSSCKCPDHSLLGRVVSPSGQPLQGVRVSLREWPGAKATSDAYGSFRMPGVCADSLANVSAHVDGFLGGEAQAHANSSVSSVVTLVLEKLEKPYLEQHPLSRVEEAGGNVTFCCKALGPAKYAWFHNGSLLGGRAQGQGRHLELRELRLDQAGSYHCEARNAVGLARSDPAQLTVLAPGQPACDPQPLPHFIRLPDGCGLLDVGTCSASACPGPPGSPPRCGDPAPHCCAPLRLEAREVRCGGAALPLQVVVACGCRRCFAPRALVRGRLLAADSGEPLAFARILLFGRPHGLTSARGGFTVRVPPGPARLVLTFQDARGDFVDAVRAVALDARGGADAFLEVRALRKGPPLLLAADRGHTLALGARPGAAPLGELELPAGAFRTTAGLPYAGPVRARLTCVDPRDLAAAAAAPSDLRFAAAAGGLAALRTYGMFALELRAAGEPGEPGEELRAGPLAVRLDAALVRAPGHAAAMRLWTLHPHSGLWEDAGALRRRGRARARARREERAFLVGLAELRERRLFNLDVPERRRCFVKVRAYASGRFDAREQLRGVRVTLLNLEPAPGFAANPRAWGRFDSALTGPDGACLPAFCDAVRPDAYTALLSAALGAEELEPPAAALGVPAGVRARLAYRRSDHGRPGLKRTALRIQVARPRPGRPEEARGPVYAWRQLRACQDAAPGDPHLRFARVEADRFEFDVVPFPEAAPEAWTGHALAWWPDPQAFRACFLKVRLRGAGELVVRARSEGGMHPRTRGRLYGLRDVRSVRDSRGSGASAACVEFKCAGLLFDRRWPDRPRVTVTPQGSCRRAAVNPLLRAYLRRRPPHAAPAGAAAFALLAPLDALGHSYGVYTARDRSPRLAKEAALGRCFRGSSDATSRRMRVDAGVAVTFQCQEPPADRPGLAQRLLEAPAGALGDVLGDIAREMAEATREEAQGLLGDRSAPRDPGNSSDPEDLDLSDPRDIDPVDPEDLDPWDPSDPDATDPRIRDPWDSSDPRDWDPSDLTDRDSSDPMTSPPVTPITP
ncbi:cartilage intermediate layer protein 2 isoform X1 [Erinaceus europaeus]|uniref:Cartilage intermediate layer protein 2 isoform X1 n=1 Tax=Erinaceus europaeus TaxID=9365 RepID=A0ABM3WMS3_ERIEU|nr:cartilage intermediate layer protein 2 isoform X1 [Erinaceus europaeus]